MKVLLSTKSIPGGVQFNVRVKQHGQNAKLYNNCEEVYIVENAYVIVREHNHITTHNMDKCILDIN